MQKKQQKTQTNTCAFFSPRQTGPSDTLAHLAVKFNLTVPDLKQLNRLGDNTIFPGQVLRVLPWPPVDAGTTAAAPSPSLARRRTVSAPPNPDAAPAAPAARPVAAPAPPPAVAPGAHGAGVLLFYLFINFV